jgi:NADH-ubiquinone oxidoreductase chain 3
MTSTTFFFIFIPLLAIILLAVNLIFAPHNPYQEKDSAFECGFHSFLGQNRTQFSISFFIFALLFLLFDLEILLVYPYVVSAYTNGVYGLILMLAFFSALTLGFVFEFGKNALKIESRQTTIITKNSDVNNNTYINSYQANNITNNKISVIRASLLSDLLRFITKHSYVIIKYAFYFCFLALIKLLLTVDFSVITYDNIGETFFNITILDGLILGLSSLVLRFLILGYKISIKSTVTNILFFILLATFKLCISGGFSPLTLEQFTIVLNLPVNYTELIGIFSLFLSLHVINEFMSIVIDQTKYTITVIKDGSGIKGVIVNGSSRNIFNTKFTFSDLLDFYKVKLEGGPTLDSPNPKLYNAMGSSEGESSRSGATKGESSGSGATRGESSRSGATRVESSRSGIIGSSGMNYVQGSSGNLDGGVNYSKLLTGPVVEKLINEYKYISSQGTNFPRLQAIQIMLNDHRKQVAHLARILEKDFDMANPYYNPIDRIAMRPRYPEWNGPIRTPTFESPPVSNPTSPLSQSPAVSRPTSPLPYASKSPIPSGATSPTDLSGSEFEYSESEFNAIHERNRIANQIKDSPQPEGSSQSEGFYSREGSPEGKAKDRKTD